MEIPWTVFFCMPSTLKNVQLAERYLQLVKKRYSEPANEKILGSFSTEALPEPSSSRTEGQPKVYNGKKKKQKDSQPNLRYLRDVSSCNTEEVEEKHWFYKLRLISINK